MAQTTALSLINEIEDRLGWRQSDTIEGNGISSNTRKLKQLTNRVIFSLQSLQEWPMLREDAEIITVAAYTTGTVDVTNLSATVTGTTTVWDESFKGRAIQVDGDEYIYRVKSVESATSLTLSRIYLGATELLGSYTIAQDLYSLPEDLDRPVDDWQGFFAPYSLEFTGDHTMAMRRRNRGGNILLGEPNAFTLEGLDDELSARLVRLDPFPENQRMYAFRYMKNHPTLDGDNDRVLFPVRAEGVIIETVMRLSYRDFEDDGRMQITMRDMLMEQNTFIASREITQEPIVISPSGARQLAEKRRFGRGGRRIDFGAWFDITGFRNLR